LKKRKKVNKITINLKTRLNRRKVSDEQLILYHQHRQYNIEKIAELTKVSKTTVRKRLNMLGFKLKNEGKFTKSHKKRVTHGYYLKIREYSDKHPFCERCGFDITIDVHHIVLQSTGGTNEEDNLISLCPNCHRMAHMGLISDNELYKLKKIENVERGN